MIPLFIKNEVKRLKKRKDLKKIEKYLDLPEIIVLLGMRQTGKTRLLYLTINLLFKKGIPESNIFYLSLEDPTILLALNKNIKELLFFLERQKRNKNHKIYILIDEIQYLKDPSNFLKYYYDHFPQFKFIVTGSSTFQIKKKFKDSLAGRKKTVLVKPLDFQEFLHFKGLDLNLDFGIKNIEKIQKTPIGEIDKEKIEKHFREFLLYGGYPKITLLDSQALKVEELKDVYNDYVRKDIKDIARIKDTNTYNNLIQVLASQIGNLLNTLEISNTINLNHLTLKKYLFLLENSFVISRLSPYFQNKRKEISKMPKIYLEDSGLRNMMLANFKRLDLRQDLGNLVENFVFNELDKNLEVMDRVNFWRTLSKQEVDFIYHARDEIIPIEIKYKEFKRARIPSGLRSFIRIYQPKKAVVITKDFLDSLKVGKTKVYFVPAYLI